MKPTASGGDIRHSAVGAWLRSVIGASLAGSAASVGCCQGLCVPNVWPAPDLQVDFYDLVSIRRVVTHPRTNTKSVAARTRRRWPTAALHVGLRKAALTRLAEVGCTVHQIAAISGHKTLREVQRYTEKAEQAKLAREAMERTTAAQKKQGAA
jgi:hypothetical protein